MKSTIVVHIQKMGLHVIEWMSDPGKIIPLDLAALGGVFTCHVVVKRLCVNVFYLIMVTFYARKY